MLSIEFSLVLGDKTYNFKARKSCIQLYPDRYQSSVVVTSYSVTFSNDVDVGTMSFGFKSTIPIQLTNKRVLLEVIKFIGDSIVGRTVENLVKEFDISLMNDEIDNLALCLQERYNELGIFGSPEQLLINLKGVLE